MTTKRQYCFSGGRWTDSIAPSPKEQAIYEALETLPVCTVITSESGIKYRLQGAAFEQGDLVYWPTSPNDVWLVTTRIGVNRVNIVKVQEGRNPEHTVGSTLLDNNLAQALPYEGTVTLP